MVGIALSILLRKNASTAVREKREEEYRRKKLEKEIIMFQTFLIIVERKK